MPFNIAWWRRNDWLWLIAALLLLRISVYAFIVGGFSPLPRALCQWDCNWFTHLASVGYDRQPDATAGSAVFGQADWANFPVFPGLTFLGTTMGLPVVLAGCVIANVALGVFVAYAAACAAAVERLALICFLLAYPYGFYFSVPYSEAVYASLLMAALYYLRQRRMMACGIAAGVLSATRVTGVLFAPVLGFVLGRAVLMAVRRRQWRLAAATGLPLALAPLGLLCFMLYLYWRTGDALAFMHVQKAWGRTERDPFVVLAQGLGANDLNFTLSPLRASDMFAGLCGLAGCLLAVWLLWRRRFAQAWLLGASTLLALSAGLTSLPRYVLANPVFMLGLFDVVWVLKQRWLFGWLLVVFTLLQVALVWLWIGHDISLI